MTDKKAFNKTTATLTELNRELKRLANRKCIAKTKNEKDQYDREYKALAQYKTEKFKTSKKAYLYYDDNEIEQMTLEDIKKALASISSTKTNYPERKKECLEQMNKIKDHREKLKELEQYEYLKKKLNK